MMLTDAQGLPFVGPAASFLLTQAPLISGAYTKLRVEEHIKKVLDLLRAQMDADLEREREEQAAQPDYAALLADVATAATRFLELAGPHLAKIEGQGNWQQVLDANMNVAFALERAVVAVARSMQGSLASEPLCAEQPFISVSLRGTALIHACWRVDHLWFGFCSTKNEANSGVQRLCKNLEEAHATCGYDTGYKCAGLPDKQRLLKSFGLATVEPTCGPPLDINGCYDGSPLPWDDEDEALATMEDHDLNADLLRETAGDEPKAHVQTYGKGSFWLDDEPYKPLGPPGQDFYVFNVSTNRDKEK